MCAAVPPERQVQCVHVCLSFSLAKEFRWGQGTHKHTAIGPVALIGKNRFSPYFTHRKPNLSWSMGGRKKLNALRVYVPLSSSKEGFQSASDIA